MAQEILLSISLIIGISAILTILARLIKQPPIIAYLFAGVLVGPLFFNLISGSSDIISLFSHIGVALLLFIVGLNLDIRLLKEIGKVSILAGFLEILLVGGIGFLIAYGIGMSNIASLYIGLALAFSSTVVVVKILSDKKEIDTLHGRLALGILIVQDFVAAIALMVIPIINTDLNVYTILPKLGLVLGLVIAVFLFGSLLFKKFMDYLARSQEALFLFGISWALILAMLFNKLGFSLEIGALIAGMSLASSRYHLELGGKIKPLRDFFVVLFFVFFGSQLLTLNWNLIKLALLFSIFVMFVKPLIVMAILKIFGYGKRTNFLTSISIAQISEFSLILTLLGFTLGQISQEIMSLIVLVSLITIGLSSYSIHHSGFIFKNISRFLNFFENKKYKEENKKEESYDIILFGYHRIGYKILKSLKKLKTRFIVVDYNPQVILSLGKQGINCIFGDAADEAFLDELNLKNAKLIISTIPDENSNITILEQIKKINSKAIFMTTAEHSADALDLYNQGADYVIVPQHIGGNYAACMIENCFLDRKKYQAEGKKHFHEIVEGKKNSIY